MNDFEFMRDWLHERFNPRSDQIPPIRVRGFKRNDLYPIFGEMGLSVGAEVGVADGRNAFNMCQNIPNLELHLVDPWQVYGKNPRAQDNQEENLKLAKERTDPYNVFFHRGMSMDIVRDFEPRSLDFVYIDGHHSFDYVVQDLVEWTKRVRPGGIVCGHDYYRFRWAGVMQAVDAYTRAHQIGEFFLTDERTPSFFWARPEKEI